MMKSFGWFTKCLLTCEAAAVEAGFVPEAGRDLYNIGLIARCTQHWSDEEFSSWVVSMVECYGKKSSLGVELADLYRRIGETMLDYGLISSSSNLLVSIARVISRLIVCILPTCVLDELHNAGLKELRRRCIHGGSAWERASLM